MLLGQDALQTTEVQVHGLMVEVGLLSTEYSIIHNDHDMENRLRLEQIEHFELWMLSVIKRISHGTVQYNMSLYFIGCTV